MKTNIFFFQIKNKRPLNFYKEVDPKEEFFEKNLHYVIKGWLFDFQEGLAQCSFKYDINESFENDWNFLFAACFHGHPEIVKFLVDEESANVNQLINSATPLMVACNSDTGSEKVFEIVNFLIEREAILNVTDMYGKAPLTFAATKGHLEVIKLFIKMDVFIDGQDNYGSTVSDIFIRIDKI